MSWLIYTTGYEDAEAETFFLTLEDGTGVLLLESGDRLVRESAP